MPFEGGLGQSCVGDMGIEWEEKCRSGSCLVLHVLNRLGNNEALQVIHAVYAVSRRCRLTYALFKDLARFSRANSNDLQRT